MFDSKQTAIGLINLIEPNKHVKKGDIEDIFIYLRTDIRYLLFERDALKRERDYYKGLLKGDDAGR